MDKYIIHGGRPLQGEIAISGAKNAAVAIIPAMLLVDGVCRLENIPQISDVDMLLTILEGLGARIDRVDAATVEIDCTKVHFVDAPYELMRKIRASYYFPQCSSRGRPGFRGTLWVASRVPSALSTSNS